MTSPSVSGHRLSLRECGAALPPELDVCEYAMTPTDCQDRSTVVMTHQEGNTHFETTTWEEFKVGFSDEQAGEFYIGNNALYRVLQRGVFSLRIDMWSADGTYNTAEYSGVSMADESGNFALTLSVYERGTATAGGLVTYHSGSPFSTHDDDNSDSSSCTSQNPSAWWYLVNRDVSFSDGTRSECFTSRLTSATDMTWALEDNDGVITGQVSINKVVMRLWSDRVAGQSK